MPAKRVLSPQSVWDTAALLQACADTGIKPLHATRLWSHLIRHPEDNFTDVPDLPKSMIALLNDKFTKSTSTLKECKRSDDGETAKLLVTLQDGMQVEAVIMTYDTTGRYSSASADPDQEPSSSGSILASTGGTRGHRRATLCVSSQVGCNMGCTFCSTGTMGLKGNLTAGEIIEQLVAARSVANIRNIVFMGMGEPLNNYEAVRSAVLMMTDPKFFGLGRQQVTISTVGVVPKIQQLPDDLPGISLALSLHAPTQELRQRIVPSARLYKLERLMEAVWQYEQRSRLRVFVEYVMLAGVNDGTEQAHDLGKLLSGHNSVLNLIPWNPVYSPNGPKFAAPSEAALANFQSIIRGQYGISCTIRQEKGQDISGACGQLVIEVQQDVPRGGVSEDKRPVRDIEELAPMGDR